MNVSGRLTINPTDVFVLTEKGLNELQGARTSLSREVLEVLILVDGHGTVADIACHVRSVKPDALEKVFLGLFESGLVQYAAHTDPESLDFSNFFSVTADPTPGAIESAGNEVALGTTSLQKQGYYVRIARSAASRRNPKAGDKLTVLIIEDEPNLGKLLKTYLSMEGFDARLAANRAEIIIELRRPPRPDLVLLDVMLPDADGFDILAAIRKHPVLSEVPTVMLTAKATREAVLKGLAGGADGYITKPFEVDALMLAVKAVLGLPEG